MEPPKRVLTRPGEEGPYVPYLAIGSPWVTLPMVDLAAGVHRVGFLAERGDGLLEWSGSPLFQPLPDGVQKWRLHDQQGGLLSYRSGRGKNERRLELFSPREHPALVFRFQAARGSGAVATLAIRPEGLLETIFNTYPVVAKIESFADRWTDSLVFYAAPSGFAFAVAAGGKAAIRRIAGGFRLDQPLAGGEAVFYVAFCRHPDGARTKTVHLRRLGPKVLRKALEAESERLGARFRVAGDFAPLFLRNLSFARDFTCGCTLDTGQPRLLTSRSPLYYVSGAFWARDAFYWSYPVIASTDPHLARRLLLWVMGTFGAAVSDHALYLDGRPLYPGFELDQLAAPLYGLRAYVEATGERTIVSDPTVKAFVFEFEKELMRWKHPQHVLFATFLNASDDPVTHPYVCPNNVLVWRALSDLHRLTGQLKYRRLATSLSAEIRRRFQTEGPFGPMWAYAADEAGNLCLGDEPPCSLLLLPYWGFCRKDDASYRNTVRFIYSRHNRYRYDKVKFPGVGCEHVPYPMLFGLCNALLAGVQLDEVSEVLRRAPLDNGLACESFDPKTGRVKTGRHFAAAAGFLCQALWHRFGKRTDVR